MKRLIQRFTHPHIRGNYPGDKFKVLSNTLNSYAGYCQKKGNNTYVIDDVIEVKTLDDSIIKENVNANTQKIYDSVKNGAISSSFFVGAMFLPGPLKIIGIPAFLYSAIHMATIVEYNKYISEWNNGIDKYCIDRRIIGEKNKYVELFENNYIDKLFTPKEAESIYLSVLKNTFLELDSSKNNSHSKQGRVVERVLTADVLNKKYTDYFIRELTFDKKSLDAYYLLKDKFDELKKNYTKKTSEITQQMNDQLSSNESSRYATKIFLRIDQQKNAFNRLIEDVNDIAMNNRRTDIEISKTTELGTLKTTYYETLGQKHKDLYSIFKLFR